MHTSFLVISHNPPPTKLLLFSQSQSLKEYIQTKEAVPRSDSSVLTGAREYNTSFNSTGWSYLSLHLYILRWRSQLLHLSNQGSLHLHIICRRSCLFHRSYQDSLHRQKQNCESQYIISKIENSSNHVVGRTNIFSIDDIIILFIY